MNAESGDFELRRLRYRMPCHAKLPTHRKTSQRGLLGTLSIPGLREPLLLDAGLRALQSLINAGFAATHAADTRARRAGGKSGNGTALHGFLSDLAAPLRAMNLDALGTHEGRFRKMPTQARGDIPMMR